MRQRAENYCKSGTPSGGAEGELVGRGEREDLVGGEGELVVGE